MELLNIVTARSVWLFSLAEMNPKGRLTPDLFNWIKDRYEFEKIPASIVDADEKGALVFSRGRFTSKEGYLIKIELKVYNDGVLAETISSTRDSDAFIEDLIQSCVREYGLTFKSDMIVAKLYLSEVNFHSENNLSGINKKLAEFADKIAGLIPSNPNTTYEVGGLHFWPGPTISKLEPLKFVVERKLNTLPEDNKYFSSAPLHTDDHLGLLRELEGILRE